MLTLLSPAKTLDFASAIPDELPLTTPRFEMDTRILAQRCQEFDVEALRALMSLSEPLAELNHGRFQTMTWPFTPDNARPCVLAFQGDVYKRLDAASLSGDDLVWAQDRLRILSGLYGLLRPLDLIQPYRLEMGSKLTNERGRNLYEFWGDRLVDSINAEAEGNPGVVLNLASDEYFKAVPEQRLKPRLVKAVFQEIRDGEPKTIAFLAKKARGLMARFIVRRRVEDVEGLEVFAEEGYLFRADLSGRDRLVFTRPSTRKTA